MRPSSDCQILRPVMVALAYGEPHPEEARLRAHMVSCPACGAEIRDLLETRSWVEQVFEPRARGAGLLRRLAGKTMLSSNGLAAAAAVVLAAMILCGGGETSRDPSTVSAALARDLEATTASFGTDGLDLRVARLGRELASLRGGSEDAW